MPGTTSILTTLPPYDFTTSDPMISASSQSAPFIRTSGFMVFISANG